MSAISDIYLGVRNSVAIWARSPPITRLKEANAQGLRPFTFV